MWLCMCNIGCVPAGPIHPALVCQGVWSLPTCLSSRWKLPSDCCPHLCSLPSWFPVGTSQPSPDMATPHVWVQPPFSGPATSPLVTVSRWAMGHRQGLHSLIHKLHKHLSRFGGVSRLCRPQGQQQNCLAPWLPARAGQSEQGCAGPRVHVLGWDCGPRAPGRLPVLASERTPEALRPTQGRLTFQSDPPWAGGRG